MSAEAIFSHNKAPLRRRVLGSFLAAFVGWLPFNLLAVVISLIDWRHTNVTGWSTLIAFAVASAQFVFGTWLILLLPLYLLVPLQSPVWRWPICSLCGALCGAFIQFSWWRWYGAHFSRDELPSLISAAFIGGITCLFGSLTARRFHFTQGT